MARLMSNAVRISIIGAGQRGQAYAGAIYQHTSVVAVVSVVDPVESKREKLEALCRRESTVAGWDGTRHFGHWKSWIDEEVYLRTQCLAAAEQAQAAAAQKVKARDFGKALKHEASRLRLSQIVIICVLDDMHAEVVRALATAGLIGSAAKQKGWGSLHVLCEKPLATNLGHTFDIYRSAAGDAGNQQEGVFSICHVLRYSPHNMLLKKLVIDQNVIGNILSLEHTEPVGWWHFSHSYVRGNWRNTSKSAPSLLTKSCHDIDFILWLLCARRTPNGIQSVPHSPSRVTSIGSNNLFRRSNKPRAAGSSTNCFVCPLQDNCQYSAKRIYLGTLRQGLTGWPNNVVVPDIEEVYFKQGGSAAERRLTAALEEDYADSVALDSRLTRSWYGRCVWECDNDVCDDQTVSIQWDDELANDENRGVAATAKSATFHMIAQTAKQCERRGRIYGTKGEIEYDSRTIIVHDFETGTPTIYEAPQPGGGHGGGDVGLIYNFINACMSVENDVHTVQQAQQRHLGCQLEEVVLSHAMVFAAEEARTGRTVIDWPTWWAKTQKMYEIQMPVL